MENPWLKLNTKKGPYVLDIDAETINNIKRKKSNEDYLIRLDNLPTPYSGDFEKAKILLLQLNPGAEIIPGLQPTENYEFIVYKNLKNILIKNLYHEDMEFPFFWLNPAYMLTGGFKYWAKIFSSLINNENDYKKISNKICCVQYFPYHSKKYYHINKTLDSQNYSFYLVKKFIEKPDKLIVIMKSANRWYEAIPELKLKKTNTITLKTRFPALTKNNFNKLEDFSKFLDYLEK